jgi:hypothetical protein
LNSVDKIKLRYEMNISYRSNKIIKAFSTALLSLFLLVSVPLLPYQAQASSKLDVTTFDVPSGFTTVKNTNAQARGYFKQYPGNKFCILTLFASSESFGDASTDFARRWQQLFSDMAKETPKSEQHNVKTATIVGGAGAVTYQGVDAVALLTTITVNGRLITVSGIANDEQGIKDYQTFVDSLDIDDNLVNQTAKKPQVSSEKPNITRSQSAVSQSIVGRWRYYIYSGGYYVRGQYAGTGYYAGRNESTTIDYTFNPNGTFKILAPKASLGSGTYRVSGNTLKLTYSNGNVKQFSYTFEEHPETIYRYLLLTEIGATRSFPRLQSEGNK